MEIIETGRLRRLEYEATEETAIVEMFRGIYGVGEFREILNFKKEISRL